MTVKIRLKNTSDRSQHYTILGRETSDNEQGGTKQKSDNEQDGAKSTSENEQEGKIETSDNEQDGTK